MKSCLLIFVVFISSPSLASQGTLSEITDSLNIIINNSSDTTKTNAYYQLGRQYVLHDSFSTAISVLEKGAAFSRSIDFHKGTGKIYEYIGIANDIDGNLEAALQAYDKSRAYHLKVPNNEVSLNLLDINIGVAYYFAGELGKSLEYYLKAYHEAKRIGQQEHLGKVVNNIAIIYRRSEKYKEALKYYQESLFIKRKKGDLNGEATTHQNIGILFSYMNQRDSSLLYLGKAKNLMVSINASKKDIDYVDYAIAEGYYNTDDYDKALELMSRFEKDNFNSLSESVRVNGKLVLADLYRIKNQHRRSIKILNEIEIEIGSSDYPRELQQVHQFRAKSHLALHTYRAAALDFQKSEALTDSIHSQERQKLESEMQTKYSTFQKEQEIEKLTLQQELKDLRLSQQRAGLWLISGVLLLLTVLFYRLYNQKTKIQNQNKIIARSAKEKDVLLREIHHRVKNNLQVISSLLGIQGRSIKDQKAKDAIQEGQNRVQSMSLIHQNLYKKDKVTGIEMMPYIEKLSSHLINTYQVTSGEIKIFTNIDDLTLDVETVVPIGLIINELISNSLKYAFPDNRDGTISIELKEVDNKLILTIYDDGIGLTDDQLKTKKDTFGHTLIRAFRNKLNAEISISSIKGTKVKLQIQNYKKTI